MTTLFHDALARAEDGMPYKVNEGMMPAKKLTGVFADFILDIVYLNHQRAGRDAGTGDKCRRKPAGPWA